MNTIVHFYATLRQVAGSREVEFDLPPGGTLRQLVAGIVARFPGLRNEMLDPQGGLYAHIHVFVNGRDSTFLADGLDTVLQPDDVISIFPPVGGG